MLLCCCCAATLLPPLLIVGCSSLPRVVVLNSVAVGFIFELDDVLYYILLNSKMRKAYERSPPMPGTVLDVSGSADVCAACTPVGVEATARHCSRLR